MCQIILCICTQQSPELKPQEKPISYIFGAGSDELLFIIEMYAQVSKNKTAQTTVYMLGFSVIFIRLSASPGFPLSTHLHRDVFSLGIIPSLDIYTIENILHMKNISCTCEWLTWKQTKYRCLKVNFQFLLPLRIKCLLTKDSDPLFVFKVKY